MREENTYTFTGKMWHDVHTQNKWTLRTKELGDLVSIDLKTGEHTFGPNYSPDEAAKTFWDSITCEKRRRDAV